MAKTSTPTELLDVSINVALPGQLHRKLKSAAAVEGVTIKEAVIAAVDAWTAAKR